MKVGSDHRLVFEEGEPFDYRFETGPNFKPGLTPEHIMIYGTGRRDVQSQVNAFKKGITSAHLIIGKDGREIVQMGGFDQIAVHNPGYNKTALAIRLDYPGYLLKRTDHFRSVSRRDVNDTLFAMSEGDVKIYPWPLYPKEQLDTTLAVAQALMEKYETIHSLLTNDEVTLGFVDPGPTFPRNLFREKLLSGRGMLATMDETSQETFLRAGPGAEYRLLYQDPIPASTQVSIFGERGGWVFIEALTEIQGNPWIVGWVEHSCVRARIFTPVVRDHLLYTQDGRRYKFIPACEGNYDDRPDMLAPKYIVMHFTTGTQLSSTINWFQNPASQVSTHLLVGRDGRVIQFLPFNKSAHHCGFGFWEGQRNLNRMTIGIEMDNAGYLSQVNGQWLRKKTVIPPDNVSEAIHWKESRVRGWEKFTQVQLDTAFEIVKQLVQHYNIQDILGHDMINLVNRTDPGPLFPIEEWREKLFGRREPAFQPFNIVQETEIYANPQGVPPRLDHPTFVGQLPKNSKLKILDAQGGWTLIKVLATSKGGFTNAIGWIRSMNIRHSRQFHLTTTDQVMYRQLSGKIPPLPPVKLKGSPLPAGTRVRLQETQGDWTLVFVLDAIKNIKWMEGWVKSESVQPVGG